MKLRISIIALGVSLLVNSGCSTVKSAYTGTEHSHFTNPAKIAAMNNNPGSLPVVAEPPAPLNAVVSANPGGTGSGMMTGLSTQPQFPAASKPVDGAWGGSLSVR